MTHHNSWDTGQIALRRFRTQTLRFGQGGYGLSLTATHLERENATRFQQARERIDNDAVSIKAVSATLGAIAAAG